jgi:hypothetical protein
MPDEHEGWARTWGGSDFDHAYDVVADDLGDIYVAGSFRGTSDFDPTDGVDEHISNGQVDCFLTKYDSTGEYQWTRTWGGSGDDTAFSVATSGTDYVFVAGEWESSVDFDTDPDDEYIRESEGATDGFMSRFMYNGDWHYTRLVQGPGTDRVRGVASDDQGNAYITGELGGDTTFWFGDTPHASNGSTDAFLARFYYTDYMVNWVQTWGGEKADVGNDVELDSLGYIAVLGHFENNGDGTGIDLNPDSGTDIHQSAGSYDVFLSRFTNDGVYNWGVHWGGVSIDFAQGVTTTHLNEIYAAGDYEGTIDFDPGPGEYWLGSAGLWDGFIVKYDFTGDFQWAQSLGGSAGDSMKDCVADPTGDVFVAGYYEGTVDFDPGAGSDMHTSDGADIFISRYAATSGYQWSRVITSSGWDQARGIDLGQSLFPYLCGDFSNTTDFAPSSSAADNHTSAGEYDAFLLKYLNNGEWE